MKQTLCVKVDNHDLIMELDTGAPCGIVSSKTLHTMKFPYRLQPTVLIASLIYMQLKETTIHYLDENGLLNRTRNQLV